jgi:Cyclin-dependent kinase inhibitor 3 (CDKN3)
MILTTLLMFPLFTRRSMGILVDSLDNTLLVRAASVRAKIPHNSFPTSNNLFFSSAFVQSSEKSENNDTNDRYDYANLRGFCNWIIPGKIMVGQYPGQNPEIDGPSATEVESHLSTLLQDAGVTLFVSLQSEIPPQDDYPSWTDQGGQVFLEDYRSRILFPRPFVHYAPVVESIVQQQQQRRECQYLHWPIEDLSAPDNVQSLNGLLLRILTMLDEDDETVVYIHCWGGRGRAGLTASCLLSLLFPEVEAQPILDLVQAGYDTRLGARTMPNGLSKSPQTQSQREFVRNFVKLRRQRHKVVNQKLT